MDAQKHIRLIFQRDIHPLLQILPLPGFGGGISLAEAYVLPPGQDHLSALRGQFLFHSQRDFQIDVLFPPAAVPGSCSAVVAAVPRIQRHLHPGQRGFSPFRCLHIRQGFGLLRQAQADRHAAQQQQNPSSQPGFFPFQQFQSRLHAASPPIFARFYAYSLQHMTEIFPSIPLIMQKP